MAKVVLDGVWKLYGGYEAVKDFNLEIRDEEFIILVGPSGCGKSTTLRMIAGLETITQGTISIDDRVVNNDPPKARNLAMVFQNYALYPHKNVYNNMAFGLKLRKHPKEEIERRVQDASRILGLTDQLRKMPDHLSGGQRQRVALGRAIVRKPDVFLFDEPLSNLDAKLRVHMRAELIKLHKQLAKTMIYVTHDQVEAMTMGDRIVVMKDGLIQQVGSPLEVFHKPDNKFVAGFIGSPTMNFLDCSLTSSEDRVFVEGPGFKLLLPEDKARLCQDRIGQTHLLGLRPEYIFEEERYQGGCTMNTFEADVDVIEPLGSEVIVYLVLDGLSIVAKVDSDSRLAAGKPFRAAVNMDRIHLFDPHTEQAVF